MDQISPYHMPGQGTAGIEHPYVQDLDCFQGLHRADSRCKEDDSCVAADDSGA